MYKFQLALFLVAAATAEVTIGKCPELKPVENFDTAAYAGKWYEISTRKYPTGLEHNGKCATTEYTLDGTTMKVKNSHVVNGVQEYIEGTAKVADDANKAGKLSISFKFGENVSKYPLWILTTDYYNYAIAYSCKYDEKAYTHKTLTWIVSRTPKLEGDAKTAVDNFIKANTMKFDSTKFLQVEHSDAACKFTSTRKISAPSKV